MDDTGGGLPLDDDELLRRCQRGDGAALDELVRRYQEPIFRLAFRVLGDATLADEATASVLVKMWEKCGQWRGESGAGTWIYRVAVRTVLDTRRSQRRWWRRWPAALSLSQLDHRPGPADLAADSDEQSRRSHSIRQALQQISESDRALVHLFYFEGRGLAEIEEIMGVPRETLKMRLARARERLRDLLRDCP